MTTSKIDRSALTDAARDAVVRQHHELFRAAQRAVGAGPIKYDALSERKKRLLHNQLDPLADAAVDAVLSLIADAIEHAAYESAMVVGESPMPEGSWHAGNDHGRNYGLRMAAGLVLSFAGEATR